MSKTFGTSEIKYIGRDGVKPSSWNPGGFSCSTKCDYCFSRAQVKRNGSGVKCQKCRNNEVHLHAERLGQPAATKNPKLVLVNFTCDTFDRERSDADIGTIIAAAGLADQHTYVWLTKNPGRMARVMGYFHETAPDNWYIGLTLTDQDSADAKLGDFLQIPGKKWVSYEPAHGGIEFTKMGLIECPTCGDGERWTNAGYGTYSHRCFRCDGEQTYHGIQGIVVGHDNRRGAPGTDTLDHIHRAVEQCAEANVNCYVKQLWIDGKLRKDPEYFPEWTQHRQLPWEKEIQE